MKNKKVRCGEEVDFLSNKGTAAYIHKCERLRGHKGRHSIHIDAIRYATGNGVTGTYSWDIRKRHIL